MSLKIPIVIQCNGSHKNSYKCSNRIELLVDCKLSSKGNIRISPPYEPGWQIHYEGLAYCPECKT